jgi:type II secretory pathway pseudopilin PulG
MTRFAPGRGFTLVEILVYIALFVLMASAAVASLLAFSDSFKAYRAEKILTEQVRSAYERMVADMRNAVTVDRTSSTFDVSPSTLLLEYPGFDREYTLLGGAIVVSENGGAATAVTGPGVVVDSFTVTHFDMVTTELLRVVVTASATVGGTTVTETYYSSSVLRGSYE